MRRLNRNLELALILCVVTAICSAGSHAAILWLKIRHTHGGNHHYGPKDQKALTILHGSSLAYSGLDWERISERVGGAIESWATAGSSPAEWELQHRRSPEVTQAFIVVSPYDLNEYILCDMRADIVPLSLAIGDLWRVDADWPFCKRVLGQYPVMLVRTLFPTVGRSDGVMTGVRDWLRKMTPGKNSVGSNEGVIFEAAGMSESRERLSDWSPARLQRRLVLMRSACEGRHTFNGPKKMALTRLVKRAEDQGPIIFVVVPVSPAYQKEFLTPEVMAEFETVLTELHQLCPRARLVRVDQIPAIRDDALFSDLVHLNIYGRQIATAAFFRQLDTPQP